MAGYQDHFGVGLFDLGVLEYAQPVDVVHHQVGDDQIEGRLLDHPCPGLARIGDLAVKTDSFEALGHGLGVRGVVIDDQHLGGRIKSSVRHFICVFAHLKYDNQSGRVRPGPAKRQRAMLSPFSEYN